MAGQKITVDANGNWRLYTNTLPAGSVLLGTVTRNDATGAHVQVNAGVIRSLDERRVAQAMGICR